jgi:hypothetical protein
MYNGHFKPKPRKQSMAISIQGLNMKDTCYYLIWSEMGLLQTSKDKLRTNYYRSN